MWSSVAAIKKNAASLKKFYQFMLERNEIEAGEFEQLKKTIKEDMPEWLERMKRYDDIDLEDFTF
jgi:site-specific recombinase XerD